MKQSGINYFFSSSNQDTGDFSVFYTFEEGAGTLIGSVSGGNSNYSGILANNTNFWIKPGSGFSSGSYIQVQNTSGIFSNGWTQVFVYEKVNNNNCVLFSSLNGTSGYSIGLTDSNKPYLESYNNGKIIGASYNNFSSKNILTVSYLPNFLTIGCYNVDTKIIEHENFDYQFSISQSDDWKLLPSYTGFVDYWMYFNNYYSPQVLGQIMSGFGFYPTGFSYNVQAVTGSGITGYQAVNYSITGVTGYSTFYNVGEGYVDYSGVFPGSGVLSIPITGVISSSYFVTGLVGRIITLITGAQTALFEVKTGYLSSFGMEKIQALTYIDTNDIIKDSYSRTLFDNHYNEVGVLNYSGYELSQIYQTGGIDLYLNGIAQGNSGWYLSGTYLFISGSDAADDVFLDVKSGDKKNYVVTGTSFIFPFSGQEIYLNGVNLISGLDFTVNGSNLTLTSRNTGISGVIFEYPVVLNYTTGSYTMKTGVKFIRNTSNIYQNGVRQLINEQYLEGAVYDNLSGNYYNNLQQINIYGNNDLFWE